MIKKLKKRFVLTSMVSLTILLVILICAITVLSYVSMDKAMDKTLQKLMNSPYESSSDKGEKAPRPVFGYDIQSVNDFRKSSFVVYAITYPDETKITVNAEHMHTDNLDMDEINACVALIVESEEEKGKVDSYKYMKASFGKSGIKIAFIDASMQIQMLSQVIKISCFAAAGIWLVMFIIVNLISLKAINPLRRICKNKSSLLLMQAMKLKHPLQSLQQMFRLGN